MTKYIKAMQMDRDAAADLCERIENDKGEAVASWAIDLIRAGKADHHCTVQGFARHRLAALTPSALSGDNSQSSSNAGGVEAAWERLKTLRCDRPTSAGGLFMVNKSDFFAALASLSTPTAEPTRQNRLQKYLVDEAQARERLATFPETVRQRLTRWQEGQSEWFGCTVLEIVSEFIAFDDAALTTPPTPDRIGKDAVREADVALLGARMVLEGKATNATGALAKTDWKPSRVHIEGMRNTMREAIEYIDEARTALSGTPAQEGEGERCQKCGRGNPSWSTPSPLWNAVIRGGSIDGEPLFGDMVCASCFMELAEQAGIASNWRVDAQQVNVPLKTTTPTGRVWDAEQWLWTHPDEASALTDTKGDRPMGDR